MNRMELGLFGKIKLDLTVKQAGKNGAVALIEKEVSRDIYTQTYSKSSSCSYARTANGSMTVRCSTVVLRLGKPQPRPELFSWI